MITRIVTKDHILKIKTYLIAWIWLKLKKAENNTSLLKLPKFEGFRWSEVTIVDIEREYFDKLSHMEQSLIVNMWHDEMERK